MSRKIMQGVLWVLTVIFVVTMIAKEWPSKRNKININDINSDWAKLMLVLNSVDKDYVDEVDHEAVTEDLLPLIMQELDPHSVYLPPAQLKGAEEELQGGFDGIGIQFNVPNDTAIVSNVIVGGPSDKAGLLSGDRIVKVDTITIAGVKMPQDSMVRLMKGKKGTQVVISVKRSGTDELIPFNIVRDKIPVNSVDVAFMINDTTGYIKLSKFAKTTFFEFLTATAKLRDQGMKRLVMDLRDNTGGYLDQALMISNEFLPKGAMVVYMEGKARARQELHADGKGNSQDIALAILINESSASSSEIVAGAMQDNDRATIYGVRSFGKGLVQEPVYFSDGSGIRLTVARYYTPTGRCIQKPYSDDYDYDILDRYRTGELFSADSIKVNDTLKYVTPGGKVVYGGGGIIPDVFVPIDTVGVTDFFVKCNRQSGQVKYANYVSDANRAALRGLTDLSSLNKYLDGLDLEKGFLKYMASLGVVPQGNEWEVSGKIILTQIRALIGRNTPMNDDAFYPIYLQTDRLVKTAVQ